MKTVSSGLRPASSRPASTMALATSAMREARGGMKIATTASTLGSAAAMRIAFL
jgi:hypothetical protein